MENLEGKRKKMTNALMSKFHKHLWFITTRKKKKEEKFRVSVFVNKSYLYEIASHSILFIFHIAFFLSLQLDSLIHSLRYYYIHSLIPTMIPDSIISKQGPLGHVWLAANYDKKLTKQQLMNTSIVKSTEYITNHPIITNASVSQELLSQTESTETITLRLSGQLLLGIVRIYSRKTKYLLDDVNDILYKLKASFKLSSGVNLGSDNISNQVNLPPQQTILHNLNSIILKDQVTSANLLQQEDLDLSDIHGNLTGSSLGGALNHSTYQSAYDYSDYDNSLEFPRYEEETAAPGHAEDFELDFDLNLDDDNSIEYGRDASISINDREISIISDGNKERTTGNIFDLDFGQPLDGLNDEEVGNENDRQLSTNPEQQEMSTESDPQPRRVRQKRTRITEDGQIITNNRKLVVDSQEAMEGLAIQQLKENQENILQGKDSAQYISLNLSDFEKLKLIEELAVPVATKKRKLWNLDAELQYRCAELALQEQQQQHNEDNQQHDFQLDQSFDNDSMDFDLSLPDFNDQHSDNFSDASVLDEEVDEEEDNNYTHTARVTEQIGQELIELFQSSNTVEFGKLIETDSEIHHRNPDKLPLGVVSRNKDRINSRKEATKCFFELLVLASNDCVSISQTPQETTIAGDINITSKDRLFSQFV